MSVYPLPAETGLSYLVDSYKWFLLIKPNNFLTPQETFSTFFFGSYFFLGFSDIFQILFFYQNLRQSQEFLYTLEHKLNPLLWVSVNPEDKSKKAISPGFSISD